MTWETPSQVSQTQMEWANDILILGPKSMCKHVPHPFAIDSLPRRFLWDVFSGRLGCSDNMECLVPGSFRIGDTLVVNARSTHFSEVEEFTCDKCRKYDLTVVDCLLTYENLILKAGLCRKCRTP